MRRFTLTQLFLHEVGFVREAKVIIDGRDSKVFGIESAGRFRKDVNTHAPGTVGKVTFAESSRNSLIQLADLVAGAIRRAEYPEQKDAQRHKAIIQRKADLPGGGIWRL